MSLRLRLTLVVAVTFALVVVGCIYAAHLSASSPAALRDRHVPAAAVELGSRTPPSSDFGHGGQDPDDDGRPGGPSLADPDASPRSSTRNGHVVTYNSGQPTLPIDATGSRSRAAAAATRASATSRWATTPYRMLTVALPNGGAVADRPQHRGQQQRARRRSTPRLLLIALAGTLIAASLAWLIARRTVRPIEELTDTATYVAATQDLDNPITVEPQRRDRPARVELQQHARRAAHVTRAAAPPRDGREPRAPHPAHRAAHQHRAAPARPLVQRGATRRAPRRHRRRAARAHRPRE